MSLSHFVTEAKKNTPILRATTFEVQEKPEAQRAELKKAMAEISEAEKAVSEKETPSWQQCQYLKGVGEKRMCTQYMSLCAMEKCQQKFMEANFFDFKKYLKQGKPIK